jgi:hypothetical protein
LESVDQAHLVIIGTADTIVHAAFLHLLVQQVYFGEAKWPPSFKDHYRRVVLEIGEGEFYNRYEARSPERHYGLIALIRNPWNPDLRLLWIAGLSGIATSVGCGLVGSRWNDYPLAARNAIGVLYEVIREDTDARWIPRPMAWLVRYDEKSSAEWVTF